MINNKKLIKAAKDGHIINTTKFMPSRVQKKLINFLYNKIHCNSIKKVNIHTNMIFNKYIIFYIFSLYIYTANNND